jgi:Domain of unknown function (DUF4832)/Domain of unknown function (DUF4874)
LTLASLQSERAQGRSVVMSRYHLADFRNRDLTPEYLAFLKRDFDTVRQAGLKTVVRFAYNYPMGGPDAPLARILRHLDQLQTTLRDNTDVIAFVEAGFVGCWGEWHTSSNRLGPEPETGGIADAQRQILDKLLAVLPTERMIAMRYPRHKFDYFGNSDLKPLAPLTGPSAFNGSKRSRIGHHDDCFVCSDSHGGSYLNPRNDLAETPRFLKDENLFVPQGGEPGDPETANSTLSSCPAILDEFGGKHWSVVGFYNLNSDVSAIKRWQRDGCYEEINRRLGYRYALVKSVMPEQVATGNTLRITLDMVNKGWSRPYNPRGIELVLRSTRTGEDIRLPVTLAQDLRLWLPGPNETKSLVLEVPIANTLAGGEYEVFLNLFDPAPNLRTRAEYAIQLANQKTWEASTGFNKLSQKLTISQ